VFDRFGYTPQSAVGASPFRGWDLNHLLIFVGTHRDDLFAPWLIEYAQPHDHFPFRLRGRGAVRV